MRVLDGFADFRSSTSPRVPLGYIRNCDYPELEMAYIENSEHLAYLCPQSDKTFLDGPRTEGPCIIGGVRALADHGLDAEYDTDIVRYSQKGGLS